MTKKESIESLIQDEIIQIRGSSTDKARKAAYCRGLVNSAFVCNVLNIEQMNYWKEEISKARI